MISKEEGHGKTAIHVSSTCSPIYITEREKQKELEDESSANRPRSSGPAVAMPSVSSTPLSSQQHGSPTAGCIDTSSLVLPPAQTCSGPAVVSPRRGATRWSSVQGLWQTGLHKPFAIQDTAMSTFTGGHPARISSVYNNTSLMKQIRPELIRAFQNEDSIDVKLLCYQIDDKEL
jgi:hypothetical protein